MKKQIHLFIDIRLKVALVFECNTAGLRYFQVLSPQRSDFLHSSRHMAFKVCTQL
jgi:hypothetical protein